MNIRIGIFKNQIISRKKESDAHQNPRIPAQTPRPFTFAAGVRASMSSIYRFNGRVAVGIGTFISIMVSQPSAESSGS